jgi:excisionase family DNA binding protein
VQVAFSEIPADEKSGAFMSEDRLFSVKGAAAYLGGLSPYTISAWLSQGKLRRVKVGSRTMLRQSDLDKLIAAGDGGKSAGRPRPQEQAQEPQQARQDEAQSLGT